MSQEMWTRALHKQSSKQKPEATLAVLGLKTVVTQKLTQLKSLTASTQRMYTCRL